MTPKKKAAQEYTHYPPDGVPATSYRTSHSHDYSLPSQARPPNTETLGHSFPTPPCNTQPTQRHHSEQADRSQEQGTYCHMDNQQPGEHRWTQGQPHTRPTPTTYQQQPQAVPYRELEQSYPQHQPATTTYPPPLV